MQKSKMAVWGGLTKSCEKKKGEKQRSKGKIGKCSSVINAKKLRKTKEWERLDVSSRKLEIPREHFMQRSQRIEMAWT